MVLPVSAGLVLQTLAYLNRLDPGFDPNNVLTATVSLRDARYATRERVPRFELLAGRWLDDGDNSTAAPVVSPLPEFSV